MNRPFNIQTIIMTRITFLLFISTLFLAACSSRSNIYNTKDGAINGYDPVAYFTEGKPVKGNKEFVHSWNNAEWHFASKKNQEDFAQNPEKYAPQYGGYCAFGCSEGHKAPTDPDAWTIVDNKLYLNYDTSVKALWSKDIPGHIKKADSNWPRVSSE